MRALVAFVMVLAGCGAHADAEDEGGSTETSAGASDEEGSAGEEASRYFGVNLRILTAPQYRSAVADLLGAAASEVVVPPPDTSVLGFDAVGSAQFAMSSDAVRTYEGSARAAAAVAIEDADWLERWVPCDANGSVDEGCLRTLVREFGRMAWRRALDDDEVERWTEIGLAAGEATGDLAGGVESIVSGLLQSPHFLYMVEVGTPDPETPGRLRLHGYELATRMSFFLTGSTPDDALLVAAEQGALDDVEGLRQQADRLLGKPAAKIAVRRFFDEVYRLRDLPTVVKDAVTFPEFSPELAAAMREETLLFFEDAVFSGDDFRDVFTVEHTFVDARLAELYGLPAPAGEGFVRVELPGEGPRVGVLGHASFLTAFGHPDSTSPTLRGKFVRERILCETVAKPPADVETTLPEDDPDEPRTMKERLIQHREDPACAGCHAAMDDIGLGLEQFDGIGRYRQTDHGFTIDVSSDLDGAPFTGLRELASLLGRDDRTSVCLTRNFVRVATGQVESPDQAELLAELDVAFEERGYDARALLVAIVTSDAFRYAERGEP